MIRSTLKLSQLVMVSLFVLIASRASADHHAGDAPEDIVDMAVSGGQFTTLAAALDAAGLVETLKSEGPFTVFAPTDAAFAKLPEGTIENLLQPENRDQLIAILTYHVLPGAVTAADVVITRPGHDGSRRRPADHRCR